MIKLCVEEYCHGCPEFESEVKKLHSNLKGHAYVETNIFCAHRDTCYNMKRHLEKRLNKEKTNDQT